MGSPGAASEIYDVAIAGLGATGSAAACALAGRGHRVLGLDRYGPPHALGSTHGETRMIREAYFEAPFYVPLVQRAYERWEALERRAGRSLLRQTGGLLLGPPEGELVRGAHDSARRHGLPCEELRAEQIRDRFPAFLPPDGSVGIFEPRAGFLDPELCVRTFLALASDRGAEFRSDEPLESWRTEAGAVRLRTAGGEVRARRLLVAAGAWTPALLPDLDLPLEVHRVVQHWFRPAEEARGGAEADDVVEAGGSVAADAGNPADDLRPGRFPVWAWEYEPGRIWYGFPDLGRGVKVGLHHGRPVAGPDAVAREVGAGEVAEMRELLLRYLPAAAGPPADASVCLYTMTPDGHFLIDRHPDHPEVVFASPCSGHGFKFASLLGEILADLLTDAEPEFDLGPFRLARFRS